MSSRRRVHDALGNFSHELRSFTSQLNEGVTVLKRVTDQKPTGGAREFREVLESLDTEVSDLSHEAEHLERFISGVISYEELLGHCLALYQTNRQLACKLEDHLQQFGYTKSSACEEEPEDPCCLAIDSDYGTSRDDADEKDVLSMSTPLPHRTPGTYSSSMMPSMASSYKDSHYKLSQDHTGPVRDQDMRTHQGWTKSDAPQPAVYDDASPRRAGASTLYAATPLPVHSYIGTGDVRNTGSKYMSRLPGTASKKVIPRISMDSHASSTPEAMMISPSMTALLQKYANDSGTSVTPPSLFISGASPVVEVGSSETPEGLFDVDFALSMPPALRGASPLVPRVAASQADTQAPNCITPCKQELRITSLSESGTAASGRVQLVRPATTNPSAAAAINLGGLNLSAHQLYDSPCETPTLGKLPRYADIPAGGNPAQHSNPATPGSTLRHARSMEHNRLLADRYAELEDLWVESGQAALTPLRNRPNIPSLAMPSASSAPPVHDVDCVTPGGDTSFSLVLNPVGGRGKPAQSQIPSPASTKGLIGSGYNPAHARQTAKLSPRSATADALPGRLDGPVVKSGPAAADLLSLRLSQMHLAVPSSGARKSVSPQALMSPIFLRGTVSQGLVKEAVSAVTPQQQLRRSGGKPSARGALHFSMECESVSSLIVKSAAQEAVQAAKTARAATLVTTPGRSSGRIAARSAAAASTKPTTPGRSTPPPPRQQQPQPSTSRTSSTSQGTAAAAWGSHSDEVCSPAPLQRQQAPTTRTAITKFSVAGAADITAVNTGTHARKGRASTPGPGKKVHQLYTIPISPVSSPPPSPPPITSAVSETSPRLGNFSARGTTRQQQTAETHTQVVSIPMQQRGSFGFRPSRPPTPHSAASGRGEPMDIDDEAEDEFSSTDCAPNQSQNPPLHDPVPVRSSFQHTASGTPPVTPIPAFMLSQPAPSSDGGPATMTPPTYGARAGGLGILTPNNTTSLWCDVPATPGGRRMSPGTSQLLSLAFGSDYAPLNLGYHGQAGPALAAAVTTHQPLQRFPSQADPSRGHLPHRDPPVQQQQRLSQPQRSVTPPLRNSSKKQQPQPQSSLSPPNATHNPLRHSENFMAKLLKTNTAIVNPTHTNTSTAIQQPSGSSSGKKLRASMSSASSFGGSLASFSTGARPAGVAGVGVSRSVAVLVPCREDEWSQLSSYIMHKLSCQQLNQQMESAYDVVEARCIAEISMGRCASLTLSMEDLVGVGNTTATAKLIINAMVKLKRCAISSAGDRPGVMEYRVPASKE